MALRRWSCLALLVLGACGPTRIRQGEAADTSSEASAQTSSTETGTARGETETGPEPSVETETGTPGESSTETGEPPAACGNGIVEESEQCDGDNLDGFDCEALGYKGGTLQCTSCVFDVELCDYEPYLCHNGALADAEACDLSDFGGLDCVGLGFVAGELFCHVFDCTEVLTHGCIEVFEGGACEVDEDCPVELPSCVEGHCWDGSIADLCVDDEDCAEALYCAQGQCWGGSYNQPCNDPSECESGVCNSVLDRCLQGSIGEPCAEVSDCEVMAGGCFREGFCNGL